MHTPAPHELTARWRNRWPASPPIAHRLRTAYPDQWVRFHSLPDAKRYPESADEWRVVLDRYNAVLDDLFAGKDVYVVTPAWSSEPAGPERQPDGTFWLTIPEDDPDPTSRGYTHLFAAQRPWAPGCLDDLLREVADDAIYGIVITDTGMRRLHLPYDGGADVLLLTTAERDRLRHRFSDWLSGHPLGL